MVSVSWGKSGTWGKTGKSCVETESSEIFLEKFILENVEKAKLLFPQNSTNQHSQWVCTFLYMKVKSSDVWTPPKGSSGSISFCSTFFESNFMKVWVNSWMVEFQDFGKGNSGCDDPVFVSDRLPGRASGIWEDKTLSRWSNSHVLMSIWVFKYRCPRSGVGNLWPEDQIWPQHDFVSLFVCLFLYSHIYLLTIVYSCFYAKRAELSSCDRDCLNFKVLSIHSLSFYRKKFASPCPIWHEDLFFDLSIIVFQKIYFFSFIEKP